MTPRKPALAPLVALLLTLSHPLAGRGAAGQSSDWPQFRGPGGAGHSASPDLPVHWSDSSIVVWKVTLPGPGASSPVVHRGNIYLTCYTGVRASSREPGAMAELKRHLLCLDPDTGRIRWNTPIPVEQPEQEKIREDHGYASSTPAVDDDRIYVFCGKSGVHAFKHDGQPAWQAKVGDKLNGWGSATSPVLHGNLLLVNASVESESLVALDRTTGRDVWRTPGIKESWHAPVPVRTAEGKTEIVIAMFRRIAGFDVETGAQLWRADTGINWYMCPTPVVHQDIVYSIGGRNPNGGLALRSGGRGDVTTSHVLWKVNKGSNVPSPILHQGHLYFAHENLGVILCVNAANGEVVFEERLEPSPGQIYASPILAGDRLYFVGRSGRTAVVAARPRFELLAVNTLEGNRGMFNASPAAIGSHLLLRSNRALYRLGR